MSSLKLDEECEPLRIPTDDTSLSEPWKIFMRNLLERTDTIITKEHNKNEQYSKQILELQETVAKLAKEIEKSRQWETIVYAELQRMNTQNQEMASKMTELQSFYNDLCTKKEKNNEQDSNSADNKHDVNTTKTSQPVLYGDSVASKKVKQRKRLKLTQSSSSVTENNHINIDPVDADKVVDNVDIHMTEQQNIASDNSTECSSSMQSSDSLPTTLASESNSIQPIIDSQPPAASNNDSAMLFSKEKSIAESLAEAAESVVQHSGFTYDETSGYYYDWNSKMYYDSESKLYFDHDNGIYYYYDAEHKSYLFHSQVEIPTTEQTEKDEENETDVKKTKELSDGEINSDEDEVTYTDPCIRMIVVKSDSLTIGSLCIITRNGGSIGRDGTNSIQIDEELVSKIHCKVIYDPSDKTFYMSDCKTANGTFINNERLADARAESEPIEVTHRDYLKIGSTTFSLHIHIGNDTCEECEPGNIQAIIEKRKAAEEKANDITDLNVQRKQELKNLRKRYGIKPGYLPKSLIESVPDRAEKRRKHVGSEPYENKNKPPQKASVDQEIPVENKGHKMLAKMGWKSGEGLGKSGSGITKPITVNVLEKKKGLGSGTKTSIDQVNGNNKKNRKVWEKTKERYDKIDKA